MIKYFNKKNITIFFIVTIILLFSANYYFSFSGFMAYTAEERRACVMLRGFNELKKKNLMKSEENLIIYANSLSDEDKPLIIKYLNQQKLFPDLKRCKSIQQFYFEQGTLFLILGILLFKKRKMFDIK